MSEQNKALIHLKRRHAEILIEHLLQVGTAEAKQLANREPFISRLLAGEEAETLIRQCTEKPSRTSASSTQIETNPRIPLRRTSIINPINHSKPVIYYFVNATISCPVNTGVQRVVRGVAKALLLAGHETIFVKWNSSKKTIVQINQKELTHLSRWNGPIITSQILNRYPETGEADMDHDYVRPFNRDILLVPEVTHINSDGTNLTLDLILAATRAGLMTAFIFYDATPLRRPELADVSVSHAEYMQQLLLADLVLPISNWASADLTAFFRLDQLFTFGPKPHVSPLPLPGESQLFSRATNPQPPNDEEHYILSVGSIVPHKNQMALVRAFDNYCTHNPGTTWKLKLAGNLHAALSGELVETSIRNTRIQYLGEVDDARLVDLYSSCTFTAFPSVMEGFGLPILESLWFGKPCLCANFGAMAEVAYGGGCLVVDTTSETAILHGIASLIGSADLRESLVIEARARQIESWDTYVKRLTDLLTQTASPLSKLGDIYYWIDATAAYDANTGIQRVVRGLARSLLLIGARLIPVRWSPDRRTIISASNEDLKHLAKWNGPKENQWSSWKPLSQASSRDWFLVAEVTHLQTAKIQKCAKDHKLRCAWVFHDSIPWKMPEIYPPEATTAHRDYMLSLNSAEKVLANSRFSCQELTTFLARTDIRVGELHERIIPCVLPGEVLGGERVISIKRRIPNQPVKILCVGTVEQRKNHLRFMQALMLVRERTSAPFEVVIAGGAPHVDLADQLQKAVDSLPDATWVRRVDDGALHALYVECDFTVYPSVEEGFGLPILESLWNAKPCVCAEFGAMLEVADGGGCMTLDVLDVNKMAAGIQRMIDDHYFAEKLAAEAVTRKFRTWKDYGLEVLSILAGERAQQETLGTDSLFEQPADLLWAMPNLSPRPLLSVCISTYNRSGWLAVSLCNLQRLFPAHQADVEFLVCDNASTDSTPQVVEAYLHRTDFTYVRNLENVGMLGNLSITAQHARGQYVWILGDDDLVMDGTIERVLAALRSNKGTSLVYLNYAYTRVDKADEVGDLDLFLSQSTPIGPTGPDEVGTVREMCAKSENFFTAIYCLVFRRDHALRAYSQNTSGRPFSTMITCIPTTYHVLHNMMDERAVWLGQPQLVVNLNVSWLKYAPVWILERLPEAFDVAERYGGDPIQIDRWRANLVPSIQHWMADILTADPESNGQYISINRLVNRFKHVPEFRAAAQSLRELYAEAHQRGHPLAKDSIESVFFCLRS